MTGFFHYPLAAMGLNRVRYLKRTCKQFATIKPQGKFEQRRADACGMTKVWMRMKRLSTVERLPENNPVMIRSVCCSARWFNIS